MKHVRTTLPALALALSALLAGCGQPVTGTSTGGGSGRDILYFSDNASGLPVMYQGEDYSADLSVSGGAGPYTLKISSGTLPPGIKLGGQRLTGTPTATGTYKFTLEVTDSTLSTRSKEYTVNVNTLPPLSLAPTLPTGEIRGETRIPLIITAPRNVRAARLNWELPAGVSVTRVQASEQSGVLFWQQQGQVLTVDLGFKTVPRNGVRIALISVKPAQDKAATLTATKMGYEARDGTGKLLAGKFMSGAAMTETPKADGTQDGADQPADAPASTETVPSVMPTQTTPSVTPPAQTTPTAPQPPSTEQPVTPPVQNPVEPPKPPVTAPPGAHLRTGAPL
ncbi:Ig domain-containing protein [Deinococcus sp. AJ005]|uniref:Ig domain-containing protein n=1 Tax=Deinococcus sp. AJ005 TaxID=2652443 RepID=UPI00125CD0D7|nr:Ig domain-containing protein [Deinococcus sp. AJ005]QFP77447.1 cell ssuface protein containing Ig-like domain protein [Deinococcus sp. AJ005]